jgi:hypothetical protein
VCKSSKEFFAKKWKLNVENHYYGEVIEESEFKDICVERKHLQSY